MYISQPESGAGNARCAPGQTRARPQCTPTHNSVTEQHAWNYFTQTRLLHPNFGVFSLDQIAHVGVSV